jgi:hypothetical protein
MTNEERKELIEKYAAGYEEVAKALENFPKEHLTAHPIEGKWSACEIVHHLADSEMNSAVRLRRLLAEERAEIVGYDQDDYATRFKYNEREIAPSLESFRSSRSTTLQIIEKMKDEDWLREGFHNEHGVYTPETWLKIYANHAHNHAAQINRLRGALS